MANEHAPTIPDHRFFDHGVLVRGVTRIQRSASELYDVWRHLVDVPRFIEHVERVEVLSSTRSRWHVKGPMGRTYSWEATVINDEPGRLIAWKSADDARIANAGSIRFRELDHGKGTEVKVSIEYLPAGGSVGDALAKAADAQSLVHQGLHRFRQLMETGEMPVAKQRLAGRSAARSDRPGEDDRPEMDRNVRDIARWKETRA